MNDRRYIAMKDRFRALTRDELLTILVHIDDLVLFDNFNFHEGKFCPIAVAMGCFRQENPTQESVQQEISTRFFPVNILRGVPGDFYHGDDDSRKQDLVSLIHEILNEG